jgi:hypothetical protein
VFCTALVIFARKVANRDPQLAAAAFTAAETAVQDRLGAGPGAEGSVDAIGRDAAIRNAISHELRAVLAATKAAIDEQAGDGTLDAGR